MTSSEHPSEEIVPETGIRGAIRWRTELGEAMARLIKDYERRVPHVRVDSIQISRTEVTGRLGTKRSQFVVIPRVILTD